MKSRSRARLRGKQSQVRSSNDAYSPVQRGAFCDDKLSRSDLAFCDYPSAFPRHLQLLHHTSPVTPHAGIGRGYNNPGT